MEGCTCPMDFLEGGAEKRKVDVKGCAEIKPPHCSSNVIHQATGYSEVPPYCPDL